LEASRDYSAGVSEIHFQIFFQCIAEEGKPSRGGIRNNGSDKGFVQLGEGLLGEDPRGRGYRVESLEAMKELCAKGVNI